MTTEKAVELALPILPYHRQCRIEMAKLMHQRRELTKVIELRKKGVPYNNPMVLKVDLDKIIQMINN